MLVIFYIKNDKIKTKVLSKSKALKFAYKHWDSVIDIFLLGNSIMEYVKKQS